jgi:hypothetical protein
MHPEDDGAIVLELLEYPAHVVISIEIPRAAIRQHRRFFESLVAIATRQDGQSWPTNKRKTTSGCRRSKSGWQRSLWSAQLPHQHEDALAVIDYARLIVTEFVFSQRWTGWIGWEAGTERAGHRIRARRACPGARFFRASCDRFDRFRLNYFNYFNGGIFLAARKDLPLPRRVHRRGSHRKSNPNSLISLAIGWPLQMPVSSAPLCTGVTNLPHAWSASATS